MHATFSIAADTIMSEADPAKNRETVHKMVQEALERQKKDFNEAWSNAVALLWSNVVALWWSNLVVQWSKMAKAVKNWSNLMRSRVPF